MIVPQTLNPVPEAHIYRHISYAGSIFLQTPSLGCSVILLKALDLRFRFYAAGGGFELPVQGLNQKHPYTLNPSTLLESCCSCVI